MGRWQKIGEQPTVVCDTGHNTGGWQYISQQLKGQQCDRMHIVFGMVDDKDIDSVMDMLPRNATFYFCKAETKRAISEQQVRDHARRHGLDGMCFATVKEAYNTAMASAKADDFVFVGGSSYVVADLMTHCITSKHP